MSKTLYDYAKSYINGRISTEVFVESYIELWKIERDSGLLQSDDDLLSECLSSIFCLADLFNPEDDRDEYELDAQGLKLKVSELIQ